MASSIVTPEYHLASVRSHHPVSLRDRIRRSDSAIRQRPMKLGADRGEVGWPLGLAIVATTV